MSQLWDCALYITEDGKHTHTQKEERHIKPACQWVSKKRSNCSCETTQKVWNSFIHFPSLDILIYGMMVAMCGTQEKKEAENEEEEEKENWLAQ